MATILHADMDAFYASVEQHDRPELRGKPVIVGGLGNRGVVTTASYEARPFGVRSAMPIVEARRRCPHGIFVPGRMERYSEVSEEIRRVFHEFTPLVEPLSLDEAYLDVTASIRLLGPPLEIGRKLKDRVLEATGLPVSVGIGPTLMIAKIAGALGKPDGLLEVKPEDVEGFLRPLGVEWLWGVGPVTRAALETAGIRTIADLADRDPKELEARLGSLGPALHELACGRDGRTVEPGWQRKSYGEENTFGKDVVDGTRVRSTIIAHAEAVARRLRSDRRSARTVVLKMKLSEAIGPGRFPLLTRSLTLPAPTDDGKTIAATALGLWDAAHEGRSFRLVGVSVSGIVAGAAAEQLSLFADRETPRRAALNRALDEITERFGERAVVRGGTGDVERAAPTLSIKR